MYRWIIFNDLTRSYGVKRKERKEKIFNVKLRVNNFLNNRLFSLVDINFFAIIEIFRSTIVINIIVIVSSFDRSFLNALTFRKYCAIGKILRIAYKCVYTLFERIHNRKFMLWNCTVRGIPSGTNELLLSFDTFTPCVEPRGRGSIAIIESNKCRQPVDFSEAQLQIPLTARASLSLKKKHKLGQFILDGEGIPLIDFIRSISRMKSFQEIAWLERLLELADGFFLHCFW